MNSQVQSLHLNINLAIGRIGLELRKKIGQFGNEGIKFGINLRQSLREKVSFNSTILFDDIGFVVTIKVGTHIKNVIHTHINIPKNRNERIGTNELAHLVKID